MIRFLLTILLLFSLCSLSCEFFQVSDPDHLFGLWVSVDSVEVITVDSGLVESLCFCSAPSPCHEYDYEDISLYNLDVNIQLYSKIEKDMSCVTSIGSFEHRLDIEVPAGEVVNFHFRRLDYATLDTSFFVP